MLVCGIQFAKGVSKKSGQPYEAYVLHGLSRRYDGSIEASSCWISPEEKDRSKVEVGDVIRQFRDGGIMIQDKLGPITDFIDLVS